MKKTHLGAAAVIGGRSFKHDIASPAASDGDSYYERT